MKIKFLLPVCLSLVCILCSGCESCYKPPDITGAADDGIWLYSGNYRFRSDLSEREELVAAIEIGGEVYDDLDVTYCEYAGDDVYMCATYLFNGGVAEKVTGRGSGAAALSAMISVIRPQRSYTTAAPNTP